MGKVNGKQERTRRAPPACAAPATVNASPARRASPIPAGSTARDAHRACKRRATLFPSTTCGVARLARTPRH